MRRSEGDLRSAERKVTTLMERIITCKARLQELKEYIPEMLRKCDEDVAALQLYLADAGAGKAAEDLITTFIGFAPVENDATLCAEFDKMDIVYLKEEAVKDDNPPIKFKENKFVKMFTVLTDMYGRPAYDEFDPTPCISIFFTLFFAMCMGDAGYGIALAIIGLAMRKAKGIHRLDGSARHHTRCRDHRDGNNPAYILRNGHIHRGLGSGLDQEMYDPRHCRRL